MDLISYNLILEIIRILVLLIFACKYLLAEDIVLEIPDGEIKGHIEITNTTFYSFQRIPYASRPLNDLRFQAPKPLQPWDDLLNAIYQKDICDNEAKSEDCLYINVFIPQDHSANPSVPDMFFIYGGSFTDGSSERILYGLHHVIDYGCAFIGDFVIPGNMELKDQNLALQWVKKNIQYFGDDSEKVTIFRERAAAASVVYHLLGPKSKGLFAAAICEAATTLSPWACQRDQAAFTYKTTWYINNSVNSEDVTSAVLFEFLTNASAKDVDAASGAVYYTFDHLQTQQGFVYAPAIEYDYEDAFISKRMYGTLADIWNFGEKL